MANQQQILFSQSLGRTEALLARVTALVEVQKSKQQSDPNNWGYLGNLNQINTQLFDVVEFLE